MTMQSPVAWNLSKHKPDHPAPGLFLPAPTLRSLMFVVKGEGKMREQRPHPLHPAQILISVFTLNAQPFLPLARWGLWVGEVGSVELYTTDIPSLTSPSHKHSWRPQMACSSLFCLGLSPLCAFIYAAPSIGMPSLLLY